MMRYPRLNEVLPAMCRFAASTAWWESSIQNLGVAGVKLQAPLQLPHHCFLYLRFSLPAAGDRQSHEIEVTALNVRTEDISSGGDTRHCAGLQFLDLSDESFEHIRAYVADARFPPPGASRLA